MPEKTLLTDLSVITFDEETNRVKTELAGKAYEDFVYKYVRVSEIGNSNPFDVLFCTFWCLLIALFFWLGVVLNSVLLGISSVLLVCFTFYFREKIAKSQLKVNMDVTLGKKWLRVGKWLPKAMANPEYQLRFIKHCKSDLTKLEQKVKAIIEVCGTVEAKYTHKISVIYDTDVDLLPVELKQQVVGKCYDVVDKVTTNKAELETALKTIKLVLLQFSDNVENEVNKAKIKAEALAKLRVLVESVDKDLSKQVVLGTEINILNTVLLPQQAHIYKLKIGKSLVSMEYENDKVLAYLTAKTSS